MKKENLKEKALEVCDKINNLFIISGTIDSETISILTYEFVYLRLISLREFKSLVVRNEISLELITSHYRKNLDSILNFENTDNNNSKIYNKRLIEKVLDDLDRFRYLKINILGLNSILASYNDDVLIELMKLDLSHNGINRRISEFSTPKDVCEIILEILDVKENEEILDIGSGSGNFLANINSKTKLNGIEISPQFTLISEIRLACLKNEYEIINTDLFQYYTPKKYNKIFCNYPWGMRIDKYKMEYILNQNDKNLFDWKKISSTSTDWMFINSMLTLLDKKGKAIAIMPDGPLFKSIDSIFRKDLVEGNYIEKIISLPNGTFYPITSIKTNIVVFSKNNNNKIEMIDASNEYEKVKNRIYLKKNEIINLINLKNETKKKKIIEIEKIRNNNYDLTVEKYVGVKEIKYHNPKKLSEFIIDSFRGYQMTADEQKELMDDNGEYEVLMISDIENGMINKNLVKINLGEKKLDRYLIKNGDLIISSKGTRIKTAVAQIGDRKIIANGNLIVLRLNQQQLNPYYLEMYLNSSDGIAVLNSIQTGAVIMSINPSRLVEIQISMIDYDQQEILAKKYISKKHQIILAKEHLKKLENEIETFYDNEAIRMFD